MLVALVGRAERKGLRLSKIVVEDLIYVPLRTQTPEACAWDVEALYRMTQELKYPQQFLGSLHSHPECDSIHLSRSDVSSADYLDELVSGVFTWFKPPQGVRKVTSLDWYYDLKPLEGDER